MSKNEILNPKCPCCNSSLSNEEIKDGMCWTCHEELTPSTQLIVFDCPNCGHKMEKEPEQLPQLDKYYIADCPKCDAELSTQVPENLLKTGLK